VFPVDAVSPTFAFRRAAFGFFALCSIAYGWLPLLGYGRMVDHPHAGQINRTI
jgi:hypothetical protein